MSMQSVGGKLWYTSLTSNHSPAIVKEKEISMKAVDLTLLLKHYHSGWVALSKDYKKVVTSAKTLEKMDDKLKDLNNPEVVLIAAANNYGGFIT
jgi:hypothetical protein